MDIPEGVIDLLMPQEDVADSGMHRPNDSVSGWDVPNMADDKECLTPGSQFHITINPEEVGGIVELPFELEIDKEEAEELEDKIHDALEEVLAPYFNKEALGLTDIPAGRVGGDVLGNSGVPQPPGLSREQGDDEETDLFGAVELIEPDQSLPSKNQKYQEEESCDSDDFDFMEYLFEESEKMAKHIQNLQNTFISLGMKDEANKLYGIVLRAQNIESLVAAYQQAKTALESAGAAGTVKMDYDYTLVGEVSFLFEGGRWTYDHSIVPEISNPTVEDIASGKDDPSDWIWGMDKQYTKMIQGLASSYNNDVLGGVIYLYDNRATGSFDATYPSEIPAVFNEAYNALKDALGAASLPDLETKLAEMSAPSVPEQPSTELPTTVPESSPEPGRVTWETHEYGLAPLKAPWEAWAAANSQDPSLEGFLAWHDASQEQLGIRTKSKTLAFLSGEAGEKKDTGMPEPVSERPIASPVSREESITEPEEAPVEAVLETTIREILDGKALGRRTDNKMERYLERVGGSKDNLKPLIDQIIMQTKPADLLEMLQDPEKKYRAVLRKARQATRRKLLGEG
jgi:hypothetical protein